MGEGEGLPPPLERLAHVSPRLVSVRWRSHPSYLQMFSHRRQPRDWTLDPAALCKFVMCE